MVGEHKHEPTLSGGLGAVSIFVVIVLDGFANNAQMVQTCIGCFLFVKKTLPIEFAWMNILPGAGAFRHDLHRGGPYEAQNSAGSAKNTWQCINIQGMKQARGGQ